MHIDIPYTQLNIGCLSRNKFWGEPVEQAKRAALCTSTLLELQEGGFLLADPGMPYAQMKETLYNRRGISIDMVKAIFLTHFHGDHMVDLDKYEHCRIYAPEKELDIYGAPAGMDIAPLYGQFSGIGLTALPGHTLGIAGLSFMSGGQKVLVAGDIVMTRDFFIAGEGYFNTADTGAMKESLGYIKEAYDVVVPGHDVQFFNIK